MKTIPTRTMLAAMLLCAACGTEQETPLAQADGPGAVDDDAAALFNGDPANGAVFAVDISHWEGPMAQWEMDCFWDQGVRHVISGTQVTEVTRQQLAMAVSRGMTIDAYVYLYWEDDLSAQVEEAFRRVDGFDIGRMWLDVEAPPGNLGANSLIASVQTAVTACRTHAGVDCGIYTGPGFWREYMANTTAFADVPLWYAWYNHRTSLSSWSSERFGGWSFPEAKQWAEEALCNVGVDKNSMRVVSAPSLVVDRSPAPAPSSAPPAPVGLWPSDGSHVSVDYLKLMVGTIPGATGYQIALEHWDGSSWRAYYTWSPSKGFAKVYPSYRNSHYRFRGRAKNGYGWGAWSTWNTLAWGSPSGAAPGEPPPPETPSENPPANNPPPADGAPTGLTPDNVTVNTSSVTLACNAVADATRYEFAIEYDDAGTWRTYTSYSAPTPRKTFWPQIQGVSYRWRVHRSDVQDAVWSAWATFTWP